MQQRFRRVLLEPLEPRHMLAADWNNPLFPIDVNDDGFVAPVDVLFVINDLNANGPRSLSTPFDNNSTTAGYIDVNGDESVSPVDALIVINRLNNPPPLLDVTIQLANDSGDSAADQITNDPQIEGHVTLLGASVSTARLRINRDNIVDMAVDSAGRFTLAPGTLQSLSDGNVKISVLFIDANGIEGLRQLRYTLDTTTPLLKAPRLLPADDTGRSNSDNVTRLREPRIEVTAEIGSRLRLQLDDQTVFDGGAPSEFRQQVGKLSDGIHLLKATAIDAAGNRTESLAVPLTIDTVVPTISLVDLAPTSDTGAPGDFTTRAARVTLSGLTKGNVFLTGLGIDGEARSSGDGTFRIPNVSLLPGANSFTLQATDLAGNTSERQQTFTRSDELGMTDPVLRWNQAALEAIRLDATPPPIATRGLAMVSIAMLDAVNAIEKTPGFLVSLPAPANISTEAAISSAAFRVINYLYPGQAAAIQTVQTAALAELPDGPSKQGGSAFGTLVGDAVVALRNNDGWDKFVDYVSQTAPGMWQETAPMYGLALLPQWGNVTPFAVSNVDTLIPAGPPELTSQQWADAYGEVKSLGSATGSLRTADQTEIARFWADGSGTYTPPGHWNQIAAQFASAKGLSVGENARLFAMLNTALGDAAIVSWKTKYSYDFWRPITAIQSGELDGNAATSADPNWSPFLISPPFPEYVSGHSTFSGAAAEILTDYFGDNQSFTIDSFGLPGVTRTFASFDAAAAEAGQSRVYGGIHFQFSNQDGLATGHALADEVLNRFSVKDDNLAPQVIFLSPSNGSVTSTIPSVQGWVIDNLAGVASATVQVDVGPALPLALDSIGRFTFQPSLLLTGVDDRSHVVRIRATDKAGLVSGNFDFRFTLDTRAPSIVLTAPASDVTIDPSQHLVGTVNGTGTGITKLTYQIDGGPQLNLRFDATGAFDQGIDLWRTTVGTHTVTVTAQDAAGLVKSVTGTFTLSSTSPLEISTFSPTDGASDIGTTFRPQITFTRPILTSTLTGSNFYATDSSGQKIAATIVPSQDGSFAWLFFANPLPGGATITIHANGGTIRDADGTPLDGDGDGLPGGEFTSSFSTVNLTPLPGTSLIGRVVDPGDDLKPMTFDDIRSGTDGMLHTSDDVFLNPISHANVYILGLDNQGVVTDADGFFTLPSVPAGTVKLVINGRTATNSPSGVYWPEMTIDLQLEVGRANTIMGTMGTREGREANLTRTEVYLPRVQNSILQNISATQTTTISVDGVSAPNLSPQQRQELQLVVQPGSVIGPDGIPIASPQVGISTVPPELVRDMLPPGVLQHTFDITIQAPGAAVFNTPLQMTFPNVFNGRPGEQLNFLSFDHTTGRLVIEGTATVSVDGLSVVTDPGVGITKPGWHGITPQGGCGNGGDPPQPPEREEDKPEDTEDEPQNDFAYFNVLKDDNGGEGEGEAKRSALFIDFPTLAKLDPPDQSPKPTSPPSNVCNPSPPPKDKSKDPTKIHVEIKVEGRALTFLTVDDTSDLPLVSQDFDLKPGGKAITLSASLKNLKQIPGLDKLNENVLFGAIIKVKITITDSQGAQHTKPYNFYRMAFWDATDDNNTAPGKKEKDDTDGTIEFEKTVGGQGITRTKQILLQGSEDFKYVTNGPDFSVGAEGVGLRVSFSPQDVPAKLTAMTDDIFIYAPDDKKTFLAHIHLSGIAAPKQELYIDVGGFASALRAVYATGRLSDTQKENFFEVNKVYSPSKVESFINEVVDNVKTRLAPYSSGVKVVNAPGPNTTRVDRFYSRDLTKAGDAGGLDIDRPAVIALLANIHNMNSAEASYRIANALNRTYTASILHNVDFFFRTGLSTLSFDAMVNSMGMNMVHELGHTVGLAHTNRIDGGQKPIDLMTQGRDDDKSRDYRITKTAFEIAVGMDWSEADAKDAINHYRRILYGDKNTFDVGTGYDPGLAITFDSPVLWLIDSSDSLTQQIDFGTVLASSVAQQTFTLENAGDQPAHLGRVSIEGATDAFSTDPIPAGTIIAPHSSLSITIGFKSTAPGTFSGKLVIDSDAAGGLIEIPLTAQTQTAEPRFAVHAVDNNLRGVRLGQSTQGSSVFTITNQGLSPLTVSSIAMVGSGGPFSLTGIPADIMAHPISLAYGDTYSFGATFKPEKVGLQRAFFQIATNDPTQPLVKLSLVGTGNPNQIYPQWGSDFVAIGSLDLPNAPVLHVTSDVNGAFSFFLPPSSLYHEAVYDPATGLIAHSYGRTAPSGGTIDLSSTLVFNASTEPDRDFDGLPDDVEFAIGTASTKADSDRDGIDDFTEVSRGTDPLNGRGLPLATIAAATLQGPATDIVVAGSSQNAGQVTAYVATGNYGLAVVDVSDAAKPIIKSEIDLPGYSSALAVDPTHSLVLVAGGTAGLQFVDVSNPKQAALINTLMLDGPVTDVETFGGVAYAAVGNSLQSIDLSTYEVLETLPNEYVRSLAREGDKLYVLNSGQLQVIDLSGYVMVPRGQVSVDFSTEGRTSLTVGNGIAYIARQQKNGVQTTGSYATYDVSDPDNPTLISLPDTPDGIRALGSGLVLNGSGLALLFDITASNLDVMDTSDPQQTYVPLIRLSLPAPALAVAVAGGFAFVADGDNGLQVVNYANADLAGIAPTVVVSTPTADADPSTPGLQVFEGSTVPIFATVKDDVQARDVELLVDGVVVQDDVSYPWDFFVIAPKLSATKTSFTVQARATDTGGNTTLSAPLNISLVADSPPTIVNSAPVEDSVLTDLPSLRINFSKPLDAGALNTAEITLTALGADNALGGGDDTFIALRPLELRNLNRTLVILPAASLSPGRYQLQIAAGAVRDRVGNVLATTFTRNFTMQSGVLSLGREIRGFISTVGQQDVYHFNALAGQRLFLDSLDDDNESISAHISSPSGVSVWKFDRNLNYDVAPFSLIESGSYTLTVYGQGNSIGDYGFRLLDTAAAPLVSLGTTLTSTFSPFQRTDLYRITGQGGTRLAIDHQGTQPYDTRISIYSPGNQEMSLGKSLPVDGTYLVAVAAFFGTDPLSYKFSIVQPGDSSVPMTFGQTISETIGQVGERDHYTFQGTAGQRLLFDSLDGTAPGMTWTLYDPSGNITGYSYYGANSDSGPIILPQSGSYDFVVQGDNEATGVYRFRLVDLATVPTLALNTLVSGTLISPQEALIYQFIGTAGTAVYLANFANNENINLAGFYLYGNASQTLGNWNQRQTSDQSVVLPNSGTYYLVVANARDTQTTAFDYAFHLDTPASTTTSITLGSDVSDTFNFRGEVRNYTFDGAAGQQIYFDNQDLTANNRRLIAPSGLDVASSSFGNVFDFGPITLAETGTYRFEIRPATAYSYATVPNTYKFRIFDLASAAMLVPGVATTASFATGLEATAYRFTADAGQQIAVTAQSVSRTISGSEKWNLYDVQGRLLASNSLGSSLVADCATAGTYALVLSATSSDRPLDLQFQTTLSSSTPVTPSGLDTVFSGSVAANTQTIVNFTANGATLAYLDLLPGVSGNLGSSLVAPSGSSVVTFSNSNFGDVGPFVLPQSGAYSVKLPISPSALRSGNYAFKVVDVAAVAVSITLNSRVIGTAPAGETAFFRLTTTGGERIYLDRLSNFERELRIYTSDGRSLSLTGLQMLPAGTNYIVFQNTDSTATNYSFRLADVNSVPELTFDSPLTAPLNPANQRAMFQFQGTVGEQFLLHPISDYDSAQSVVFIGPDGQSINEISAYGDTTTTLRATGTYTLIIETTASGDTSYQFLARRQVPVSTPIQFGTVIDDSTAASYDQKRFTFTAAAGARLYYDSIETHHTVIITGPSGEEIAASYDGYDAALPPLPESGTYTILFEDGIGTISFRLLDLSQATPVSLNTDTTADFSSSAVAAQTFKFHGSAGQQFYFDNRSSSQSTPVNILDAANKSIAFGNSDFAFTTPQDADYLVVIAQSYSPSFRFLLASLVPNEKPLDFNTLTSGSIDRPGQTDVYTFQGNIGQRIAWDAVDDDSGKRIRAKIVSPSGVVVIDTNTYQGNEPPPVTLTENGPYQLIIGGSDVLGSYDFQLLDAATSPALELEADLSGTLNPALSNAIYRFNGQSGQRLFFDAQSFSSIGGTWFLYGPGNQQLASAQFSNDMEVVLPATGAYLLELAGRGAGQINYAFHVYTPAEPTTALSLNVPVMGTLTKPGQIDVYTFTGAVDDRLFYDAIDGGGASMNVRILDPNNQVVAGTSGDAHADQGPITLALTGTYRLVVDGNGEAVGSYQFRLLSLAAAPQISLGTTVAADLTPGYETDIYQISATAGDMLTFDMISASPAAGFWKLYGPANQSFNSASLPGDFAQTTPATGNYILIVSGNSVAPIDYQFRVANALMLASETPLAASATQIQSNQLAAIVAQATTLYAALGLPLSASHLLSNVAFHVVGLPTGQLGEAGKNDIWIDDDAGGTGWFVDETPATDEEFLDGSAIAGSAADGHVDLLTVVLHELGHVLGLDHFEGHEELMFKSLNVGRRKNVSANARDALFALWK